MSDNRTKTFHVAIEKMKKKGRHEIYFYTIPSGFNDNEELLEYFREREYQAEIIDGVDGYGVLHISW